MPNKVGIIILVDMIENVLNLHMQGCKYPAAIVFTLIHKAGIYT